MSIKYRDELMIDHRSNKPIFEQIYTQLERLLSSARVINNESIIKASELAKILSIPLEEVEKAYGLLEKNNFISYDDSNLPYVCKYDRILNFFSKIIYIEDGIRSLNKELSIDHIDFNVFEVEESDVIPLEAYKDRRFLRQIRLFKADDIPYFYLEEYYPVERFPKLLDLDKEFIGKIYSDILQKEYNIQFLKNGRKISVQCFEQELSKILEIKQGLPGFKIDLVYYDQNNIAFGYGVAYSLPHFYFEYNIDL